jgi:hypothetical protein
MQNKWLRTHAYERAGLRCAEHEPSQSEFV